METAAILYEVPLILEKAGVADFLIERFKLKSPKIPDWNEWQNLVDHVREPKPVVKVALIGKYVELHDAYMTVAEALKHAGIHLGVEVDIQWVHSADLEKGKGWDVIQNSDGIIVPGGFGSRGIEGKIQSIRFARENKIPYLGLCLGMQLMVVEFARYAFQDEGVNSTEFDHSTLHPVIDLMSEQRDITDMGGTMRLGLYPCVIQPNTISSDAYKTDLISERHRHRFEFNNAYRQVLQEKGMRYAGLSPDGKLVEIAELIDHPFMVGTQFHPEFLSRPNRPHPLFVSFIHAVCDKKDISTNGKLYKNLSAEDIKTDEN
jgi:CTP synthase